MSRDDAERLEPGSPAEWRAWLEANHHVSTGVWLVLRRSGPPVNYEEAVCEALCFGWIDGQARPLDDERSFLWFTKRRANSGWAASNKARIARLEAEGRMHPAGVAVVEEAKRRGMWTILDDAEALIEPPDLVEALDSTPGARAHWDTFPPSARKIALSSIALAKREETRAKRIATYVEQASRGERPH